MESHGTRVEHIRHKSNMTNQLPSNTVSFKFSLGQEVWLIWGHHAARATVLRQVIERRWLARGPDDKSISQTETYEVEMVNHKGQPVLRDAQMLFASKQELLDRVADEGD